MDPMTVIDFESFFPHLPASAQSSVGHLRALAGQYAVSQMPKKADQCKGRYLKICSKARNKLNEE